MGIGCRGNINVNLKKLKYCIGRYLNVEFGMASVGEMLNDG